MRCVGILILTLRAPHWSKTIIDGSNECFFFQGLIYFNWHLHFLAALNKWKSTFHPFNSASICCHSSMIAAIPYFYFLVTRVSSLSWTIIHISNWIICCVAWCLCVNFCWIHMYLSFLFDRQYWIMRRQFSLIGIALRSALNPYIYLIADYMIK